VRNVRQPPGFQGRFAGERMLPMPVLYVSCLSAAYRNVDTLLVKNKKSTKLVSMISFVLWSSAFALADCVAIGLCS